MKVLITGAFGNVGSHSLRELLARGHTVRAFDVPTPANQKIARRYAGRVD
jgi:nucleoside-diphosphate-sugar epimerase